MFCVSCLGIWWRHDIWISEKLKFDYLKNEKSFQSEIKNIFFVSQVLSFRYTKQKTTFNNTFPMWLENVEWLSWCFVWCETWKLWMDPIILFMNNGKCSEAALPTRSLFSNHFGFFLVYKLTNSCVEKHISLLLFGFDGGTMKHISALLL